MKDTDNFLKAVSLKDSFSGYLFQEDMKITDVEAHICFKGVVCNSFIWQNCMI